MKVLILPSFYITDYKNKELKRYLNIIKSIFKLNLKNISYLYNENFVCNEMFQYADFPKVLGKENVHIIWYSDFKENTANELNKVISFLGLNTDFKLDFNKIHNSFSMPKNNFIRKIYSIVWLRKTLPFLFPANFLNYIKTILFNRGNKPKLSDRIRELLHEYYLPDIERLEELLSVNLSQWKK